MRKRWYAAAAAAALALLLVSTDTVSAQRFGRLGRWGGGYGGYGSGLGGWGYGSGYGGLGYGGYGLGGTGYYPYTNYGYGVRPGYYSSGFVPSYGYGGMYSTPGYVSSPRTLPGNTMSMYYQPGTQLGAATTDPNAAVIDLRVPADAQVWFDGDPTNQRGPDRIFTSPALQPGKSYHYEVKARWTENGRPVERTRRVDVRAGQRTTVDFTQDQGLDRDRDRDLNTDRNLNRDRDRDRDLNPDRNRSTNPPRSPNRNPDRNPGE